MKCFQIRQRDVDERMRLKRAKTPAGRLQRITIAARALKMQASKLGPDADNALRLGAAALNANAEQATEMLRAAVDDPESPFHRQALEWFATRTLPMAAITRAAVRFVRAGALAATAEADARFTLNISLTHGPEKE